MYIKFHSFVFALTETFICIVLCEENFQGEKKRVCEYLGKAAKVFIAVAKLVTYIKVISDQLRMIGTLSTA